MFSTYRGSEWVLRTALRHDFVDKYTTRTCTDKSHGSDHCGCFYNIVRAMQQRINFDPSLDDTARIDASAVTGDAHTSIQFAGGKIGKTMDFGSELDPKLLSQFDDEDDPTFLNELNVEKQLSKGYFRPDSVPRTYWEMLMVFFTMYCAFAIPLYMAWDMQAEGLWRYFEYCMDFSFCLDLFLCMRTGYYDPEFHSNIYDQRKIIIRYAKGWLFIDAFAAFPLSLVGDQMKGNMQAMRYVRLSRTGSRLLRMVKVIKANQLIVDAQNNYEINPAYIKVLKFSCAIVMMTHMLACLWYAAARMTSTGVGTCEFDQLGEVSTCTNWGSGPIWTRDTWLMQYGIPESSKYYDRNGTLVWEYDSKRHTLLWEQYTAAVYWCICTVTTVGYGDISANSAPERTVAIFAAAVGATTFAFVCGNMTSIVVALDKDAFLIQRKLDALNSFMRIREISKPLRVKCRAFCRHVWDNTVFNEAQVVKELSPGLRMQISLEIFRDVVKEVPLFKPLRDTHVALICQRLRNISVAPAELVVRAGDEGKEMYIIQAGILDVISEDGSTKFATLRKGAYFGEISVVLGQRRTANVRARILCDLMVLRMRDFNAALGDYPEITELLRTRALQTLEQNESKQKQQRQRDEDGQNRAEKEQRRAALRAQNWASSNKIKMSNPLFNAELVESSDSDSDGSEDKAIAETITTSRLSSASNDDLGAACTVTTAADGHRQGNEDKISVQAVLNAMSDEEIEAFIQECKVELKLRSKDHDWSQLKPELLKEMEELEREAESLDERIKHFASAMDGLE
eukprot:SAG31_NODE_582_length_13925_cov_32.209967_5_plen_794_part_00